MRIQHLEFSARDWAERLYPIPENAPEGAHTGLESTAHVGQEAFCLPEECPIARGFLRYTTRDLVSITSNQVTQSTFSIRRCAATFQPSVLSKKTIIDNPRSWLV